MQKMSLTRKIFFWILLLGSILSEGSVLPLYTYFPLTWIFPGDDLSFTSAFGWVKESEDVGGRAVHRWGRLREEVCARSAQFWRLLTASACVVDGNGKWKRREIARWSWCADVTINLLQITPISGALHHLMKYNTSTTLSFLLLRVLTYLIYLCRVNKPLRLLLSSWTTSIPAPCQPLRGPLLLNPRVICGCALACVSGHSHTSSPRVGTLGWYPTLIASSQLPINMPFH